MPGAYDLFHNDDDSAIQQFEAEDIDSILERRATTIVHSGGTSAAVPDIHIATI